jgi:DNA-directed RNA polymerase subunit K/omega
MVEKQEFTKYERARIIGARGLQISMDAPLLMKMDEEELNGVNFDPLRIAEKELDSGVLPISINRPLPKKVEEDIKKLKIEDSGVSDAEKIRREKEGEALVKSEGLIAVSDSEEERLEAASSTETKSSEDESLTDTTLVEDTEEDSD